MNVAARTCTDSIDSDRCEVCGTCGMEEEGRRLHEDARQNVLDRMSIQSANAPLGYLESGDTVFANQSLDVRKADTAPPTSALKRCKQLQDICPAVSIKFEPEGDRPVA